MISKTFLDMTNFGFSVKKVCNSFDLPHKIFCYIAKDKAYNETEILRQLSIAH